MIAWKMLLAMLPKEAIQRKDEVRLELTLVNGSEIALKGADNEDSLRGAGLFFVVLDEYAMMKGNVWQEIIRPMLTDTKGRALFIGTPKGKNSLWELYVKGQRKEDGFSSYLFKTTDNPYIDPEEVLEAKKQLNDRYFRQEYEASFEDYVGLVYPEFEIRRHVIQPIYLPVAYRRIAAIDPAIYGTTCVLKAAIDENGVLYVFSEYYETNKRASEIAQTVKEDNLKYYIDPASMSHSIQKEGKMFSLFDEYKDNGVYAYPAENDVDAGINRVAEYFKSDKLKIFNVCHNLIRELERYHWSEEKELSSGMSRPKPYKKDDHACDALRYLVMSRFSKTDLREEIEYPPLSAMGKVKELKRKANERVYAH
jgi:PBSX family phage terminase large subunit